MADEKTITEPQIDMSRLEQSMKSAVQAGIAEVVRTAPRPQPVVQRPQEPDPVAEVLRPIVGPDLMRLNFKADDAKDAVIFYNGTPEATKHSEAIEAKFNEMAQNGRPMNRASIWQWIRGSDAFVTERIKQRDAEIETARQAQTIQGSRGGVPTGRPNVDITTSDDDLAAAVTGLEF